MKKIVLKRNKTAVGAMARMTDKQLIADYKGLYSSIHITECYGINDLTHLELVTNELGRRGYEFIDSVPEVRKRGTK